MMMTVGAVSGGLIATRRSDVAPGGVAVAATSSGGGVVVSVDPGVSGRVIPAGFLGLSFEYWALENMAGRDPGAVNPVLVRLIRNLVMPGAASVRIGGVTTDQTWWPVAGVPRPPGVRYSLTRRRLAVARALAQAVGARLIMGVNFEADSRVVAGAEARAMLRVIGRRRIQALELGNEPELYGSRPWYSTPTGREVSGRPADWWFPTLNQDYAHVLAGIGSVPLAGPSIGSLSWMADLSQFLAEERQIKVVTLHRYPLQSCSVGPGAPNYPTIAHLLSVTASSGLAHSLAPYVSIATGLGLPVRSDEMNSVACGYSHNVSNTFGSALWAADALFQMASVGVDGVNMHTYPGAGDQLFAFTRAKSRWRGVVAPEYYGLLMFARAAPRGSRLLHVTGTSPTLRVWATRGPSGRVRVLAINDDMANPQRAVLRVPGAGGTATLERLQAPSVHAIDRIKLAGQVFAHDTTTGLLAGRRQMTVLQPNAGAYTLQLSAASAALIQLPLSTSRQHQGAFPARPLVGKHTHPR